MSKKIERTLLGILLGLSILGVLLIKTVLSEIPEGWAYGQEAGEIIYDLCLAYIASWIFYIIVVVIPKKRDERNINNHAARIIERITYAGLGLLRGLSTKIGDHEKILSETEFIDICNKIGPDDIQDLFITVKEKYPITYLQHLNRVREKVKAESQNLFIYISHLDPELIRLTNDVLYSQFMVDLDAYFLDKQYRQPTFEHISYALYDFYKKVDQLKEYRQLNM